MSAVLSIFDEQDGFTAGYAAWVNRVDEPPWGESPTFYAFWAEGWRSASEDAREELR